MPDIASFAPPASPRSPIQAESLFCVRPCIAVRPIHQYRTALAGKVRTMGGMAAKSCDGRQILEELHALDVYLSIHYRNCGCIGRRGLAS